MKVAPMPPVLTNCRQVSVSATEGLFLKDQTLFIGRPALNGSMVLSMFLRRLTGLLPVVVPPVFLSAASRTSSFCFIMLFAASSFRELFLCLPAGFLAGSFWLQLRFELWKNSKTQYKIQKMEDWYSCRQDVNIRKSVK
jgi:hypothetical protein